MTKRPSRLFLLCLVASVVACGSSGAPSSESDDAGVARDAAASPSDGGSVDPSPPNDSGTRSGEGGVVKDDCLPFEATGGAISKWVHADATGKLAYAALPTGERILDFSYAGYGGGGVAIPMVPVARTVTPSGGDDTTAIQNAIDAVSQMAETGGMRGAVLLAPGTFQVSGTLAITVSGVVLRGSGSGAQGTVVLVTGSPRMLITIQGSGSWRESGTPRTITDAYVPSGAHSFRVDSTAGLAVGQAVLVNRPVTAAWVHFMGMDALVRDGGPETWIAPGSVIRSDRIITAISGSEITVDAPLSDSLDAQYVRPGATVVPYTFAGRIEHVGLESVRIVAPKQSVPINQPIYGVLDMNAVANGWVRDVAAEEFTSGFALGDTAKWITLEDSSVARTAPIDGSAGYPFHYSIAGQQTLVQRCSSSGDHIYTYATMSRTPGPNVLFRFAAKGNPTNVEPHQRWATGLLVDGASSPTGGINLKDRGIEGSGHGWAIGFGVVWNSVAASLLIQKPPGASNWAIGSTGTLEQKPEPGSTGTAPLPEGIIDSHLTAVAPKSLYLAQLCERLGRGALANIGY